MTVRPTRARAPLVLIGIGLAAAGHRATGAGEPGGVRLETDTLVYGDDRAFDAARAPIACPCPEWFQPHGVEPHAVYGLTDPGEATAAILWLDPARPEAGLARIPAPGLVTVVLAADRRTAAGVASGNELVLVRHDPRTGTASVSSFAGLAGHHPVRLSPRGTFAVVGRGPGGHRLYRLDGPAPVELARVEGHRGVPLAASFSGDETLLLTTSWGSTALLHRIEGDSLRRVAALDLPRGLPPYAAALTPDGRRAVTGSGTTLILWGLDPEGGTARRLGTGELPARGDETVSRVEVSPDGAWILAKCDLGAATVFSFDEAAGRLEPRGEVRGLVTFGRDSVVDAVLAAPERLELRPHRFARRARIGADEIELGPPGEPARAGTWPWLVARATWRGGVRGDGRPAELTLEVRNDGASPAHEVVATLASDPPGAVATASFHVGTVRPGRSVRRTVPVPRTAALDGGDAGLTLGFEDAGEHAPAPLRWHHLPRTVSSAAGYDALAARVHAASVAVVASLLGDPRFAPGLEPLTGDEAVGFKTLRDPPGTVLYQNPFTFSRVQLDLNRRVMRAADEEQVLRDGELMLLWFLPHEAVHAARGHLGLRRSSWFEELVANALQPRITERVLRRLGDVPWSEGTFRRVYDRYVERLGERVAPGDVATVERFLECDGARPPFPLEAGEVFEQDVALYVYFGARVNQHALASGRSLEELAERYLRAP